MKRLLAARVLLALVAIAAGGWTASARADARAETEGCEAWPGEIAPLPTVAAPDPITAMWARERVRALAADARLLEAMSVSDARRYWDHVLCLDPHNDAARAGLFRTGPFRVSGPLSVDSEPEADAPAEALDMATLTARLNPGGKRAPRPSARPPGSAPNPHPGDRPAVAPAPEATTAAATNPPALPSGQSAADPSVPVVSVAPPSLTDALEAGDDAAPLSGVDQEISEIATLVADAHFATALSVAASTRALLQESAGGAAIDIRRARLEVLSATAAVALGRDADALVSMSDALRADPELELDTGTTSPKVVAIFEEARRRPRPPRAIPREPTQGVLGSSADFGALRR